MRLRRERNVPGLNTTSTADISFMLLVFFLVTTSMFVDKGLSRQIPPKDKQKEEQKEINVDKENMLSIRLDSVGIATFNDSVVSPSDYSAQFAEFIIRRGKEHLVAIDASEDCPYEAYFLLQHALGEAYAEARETMAKREYNRSLAQLTSIDREKILEMCPQRVAENYHDMGGAR